MVPARSGLTTPAQVWASADPAAAPAVGWLVPPPCDIGAVLLGAFDPVTNAHLALARAGATATGAAGVLCMTKVMLARPPDQLFDPVERLELLAEVVGDELGVAVANRGTYVEVAEAFSDEPAPPAFIVGSDKLAQIADPSFYSDGAEGVARTMRAVRFLVVQRGRAPVPRGDYRVLPSESVFDHPKIASLSASDVRAAVRDGRPIERWVPAPVARRSEGYTASEPT